MNEITPKEAIANLNHLYGMVAPDIQRSLDVAIKALERPQGKQERPQGDLISREAFRSALEVTQYNDIDDLTRTERLIDNAPPVDAYEQGYADGWKERYGEPDGRPKGKWIITREEQGSCGIIYKTRKCNKCGWEFSLVIPRNFCPECGADMREEERGEEK